MTQYAKLKKENSSLKDELDKMFGALELLGQQNKFVWKRTRLLEAENKQLREALDVVYTFLELGSDYSDVIFDSVSNALKATSE